MDFVTLELVKGLGAHSVVSNSAEIPLDPINLMNIGGFSIEEKGWIPSITQVKNDGQYAESDLSDGRTLVAAAEGNVRETMTLTATAATLASRYLLEKRLLAFADAARENHISDAQIEPVYLKVKFKDAPGEQYAHIYNIQFAQRSDPFAGDNINKLTITIEREPFWCGLPPGANPKIWSYYANGGSITAAANLLIRSTTGSQDGHLVYGVIRNCLEWTNVTTISAKNYIDIPASKIPGDAPALACIVIRNVNDANTLRNHYIARSTKATALKGRDGNDHYQIYSFPAAASALGTDASKVADTGGVLITHQSASRLRGNVSFAGGTADAMRFRWQSATLLRFSMNTIRGHFAVFARARQDGGTLGQIKIHLEYGLNSPDGIKLPERSVPLVAGSGNTSEWPVIYMGQIMLPPDVHVVSGVDGQGLGVPNALDADVALSMWSRRSAGAGVLYVCDLILIPIDEPSCQIVVANANVTASTPIIDATCHLSRGKKPGLAGHFSNYNDVAELRGQFIELIPGVNNRLYFFGINHSTGLSPTQSDHDVWVDIIPRWRGIRDV